MYNMKSVDMQGQAMNKRTLKTRWVKVGLEALQQAMYDGVDECSGPCECRIETDGTCENGWPSRMRAVGVI